MHEIWKFPAPQDGVEVVGEAGVRVTIRMPQDVEILHAGVQD